MITPEQSRAARGILRWTVRDLADRANLAVSTVNRFEVGKGIATPANRDAIGRALSEGGVEFGPDGSVRRAG